VSGDYFDYIKLDDKHYAIIKCDVAGKGVPAALIMVEVATLFAAHFRNWTLKSPGLAVDRLVYTINDMLEERKFKGRFAALTVGIINMETGLSYFCNAGDKFMYIYSGEQRRMVRQTLPETPAAGVFPSTMVEMQVGFKLAKHRLQTGDTLFLFTDGLEEAQRLIRDENYKPMSWEEVAARGWEIEEAEEGEAFELLDLPRINSIFSAVFSRGRFKLEKYHNPDPDEEITFDFSTCEGTVEEAVLGVLSVEKLFRTYRDAATGPENTITVDRQIDGFLQKHFVQYSLFFQQPLDQENGGAYVTYGGLKEDGQYDDLTILGIKKV
jgi:hypothetical protein